MRRKKIFMILLKSQMKKQKNQTKKIKKVIRLCR